jgi:outer membrane protein OmpA-like peptidoglycan-associated protein
MARLLKYLLMSVLFSMFASSIEAATVIGEKIIFLKEDGQHGLTYYTTRTDYSNYTIWFEKEEGETVEDILKDYLYFYPNDYHWDTTSNHQYNLLKIPQGSYANLSTYELSSTVGKDGIYTYKNWDGKTKTPEGHFGDWNTPDNFTQYVYVWVFPKKFDIVKYECNRTGEWVKRQNAIAYYGKNINDLVFTIKYRPRSQATYEILTKSLAEQEQVQLVQQKEGVKIMVGATVLFPSGSNVLTKKGRSLLEKVIYALKKRGKVGIIVEGHTDNIPIKGELSKIYPTNWELSAARALTVLHYLAKKGIPESRLESIAYGSQRPIASNKNEQGRSRNRRIELMIKEPSKP